MTWSHTWGRCLEDGAGAVAEGSSGNPGGYNLAVSHKPILKRLPPSVEGEATLCVIAGHVLSL